LTYGSNELPPQTDKPPYLGEAPKRRLKLKARTSKRSDAC
jgi:hypothetical protein